MHTNTTNFVKDIFVFPTEDIQKKKKKIIFQKEKKKKKKKKKKHLVVKKCWHCKSQLEFGKKPQNINPR